MLLSSSAVYDLAAKENTDGMKGWLVVNIFAMKTVNFRMSGAHRQHSE